MISSTTLITALAGLSAFTSLVVEGVKKLLDEKQIQYSANLLAVIVSVASTLLLSILYVIYQSISVTPQVIVTMIALMIFSFLSSTVGYDKVKQLIEQLTAKKD